MPSPVGPRRIGERCAFAVPTFTAFAMMIAGAAGATAGVVPLMVPLGEESATIAAAALGFAAVMLLGGAVGTYLCRSRTAILPNESIERRKRLPIGGWLTVLPAAIVGAVLVLIVRLDPLIAMWSDMLAFLDANNVWEGITRAPEMSGVVVIPIAATLALPFVESAAAAAFVVFGCVLLYLQAIRSARFPRAFVASVVQLATLVVASALGNKVVTRTTPVLENILQQVDASAAAEQAQILAAIQRYNAVNATTLRSLAGTLIVFLVWTPAFFSSRRIRLTFAAPPSRLRAELPMALEARDEYYAEAARLIDDQGP